MENRFTTVMANKSNAELIQIITINKANYQPEALEAAQLEIDKRNISAETVEQLTSTAIHEHSQLQEHLEVSSGTRLANHLLDSFVGGVIAIALVLIIDLFTSVYDQSGFLQMVLFLVTYFSYFFIMEVAFQKTVGKFITSTKVVTDKGEKPSVKTIALRTLGRFIPFDRISFLFIKSGWHDMISNTKVIRD